MSVIENEKYTLEITDISINGEGIGKVNGFTLFVNDCVPGDIVEVLVTKIKKNFGYGKFSALIRPSPIRVQPKCDRIGLCGGCKLLNIEYNEQLKIKTKMVKESLARLGNIKNVSVNNTVGMLNLNYCRNKAVYHFGLYNDEITAGMFACRSHIITPVSSSCNLFHQTNSLILEMLVKLLNKYNIPIYNYKNHTGLIRHVMIKSSNSTNEIMVCLIINGQNLMYSNEIVEELSAISNVTSIILNINTKKTKEILSTQTRTLWGKSFITDYIGDIKFQISANSFFQVNTTQTKKLYDIILQFANLTGFETILDVYCGIGSISLYLAKYLKKVVGIEISKDAVCDAKQNAKLNGITNVEFLNGNASDIVENILSSYNFDLVILDPPRNGCHVSLLENLLNFNIKKIIYVSCNPATLARDLRILNDEYEIIKVQPVDMFGYSMHVEMVVLLSKKDG